MVDVCVDYLLGLIDFDVCDGVVYLVFVNLCLICHIGCLGLGFLRICGVQLVC